MMLLKITDPSGIAKGYRMGLTFQQGLDDKGKPVSVAYSEQPLNHGQIAAVGRWGYTAIDTETKADVIKPLLAKHAEEMEAARMRDVNVARAARGEEPIITDKVGTSKGGK